MSIIYKCAFGEWRAIALSKMEINAIITRIKVLLFSVFCVMNQAASTDGAQREMSPRSSGDLWPAPVPPPSDHHSPQVRALVLPDAWGEGFPQGAGLRGVGMLLRARLGSWGPHISPGISPGMRRRFRGIRQEPWWHFCPFPSSHGCIHHPLFLECLSSAYLLENYLKAQPEFSPVASPLPCPRYGWALHSGCTWHQNLCRVAQQDDLTKCQLWVETLDSCPGCTEPWSVAVGKGISLDPLRREEPHSDVNREV